MMWKIKKSYVSQIFTFKFRGIVVHNELTSVSPSAFVHSRVLDRLTVSSVFKKWQTCPRNI